MSNFVLFRENYQYHCAEIDLRYCPRVGEMVWAPRRGAGGIAGNTFRVVDVMHLSDCVQLIVRDINSAERSPAAVAPAADKEEQSTPRCGDKGLINGLTRQRIIDAAMKDIQKKKKKMEEKDKRTGMTPRVEM